MVDIHISQSVTGWSIISNTVCLKCLSICKQILFDHASLYKQEFLVKKIWLLIQLFVWTVSSEQITICNKFGVVSHYQRLKCHAKKIAFFIFNVKVRVGSNDPDMTVSTVLLELLILLHPELVWWYIVISWNVYWKDLIAVFKVKAMVKTSLNVGQSYIFSTADVFATTVGMWMYSDQTRLIATNMGILAILQSCLPKVW